MNRTKVKQMNKTRNNLIIAFGIILFSSCLTNTPVKKKKESGHKEKNKTNSIVKPPRLVGCWQISKFAHNLNDFDDESKWITENGALMILRDDGRFMKWFGDYGDNGSFELHNDSLFFNLKGGYGTTKYKLVSLTAFEMILTNKDEFVPILKYRRLSQVSYDIWKARFN